MAATSFPSAQALLVPSSSRAWRRVDTLVLGGGVAGFRAATEAARGGRVLVVTKNAALESNTLYAQGGVAAVLGADDSFERHREDTMEAGGGLCEERAVQKVVEEGPEVVRELVEWGGRFDAAQDGAPALGREGGHSRRRILHAQGDGTGRMFQSTLVQHVTALPHVEVIEHGFAVDLVVCEGRCCGAVLIDPDDGEPKLVTARNTILCTGGAGQLYRETTNPAVATGDGVAMAWRAGAEVVDVEFFQFHPTTLYVAGSARVLITEAVRGEGARLVDGNGERFAFRYDRRGELAPRDVVSRAIVQHLATSEDPCVYLDLRPLGGTVERRFPGLHRTCDLYGIDPAQDLVPVHPSAHYFVGGVRTDLRGRTSLPGLWAAGEVAATGLHGANRLASNSLLEGLVFGRLAGRDVLEAAADLPEGVDLRLPDPSTLPSDVLDLEDLRDSVQSLMWRRVGVQRTGRRLAAALGQLEAWRLSLRRFAPSGRPWLEVANLLSCARLTARAALWREESRGTHFRTDFPELDPERFLCHSLQSRDREGVHALPLGSL